MHLISPNDRYDITYLRNYAIINVRIGWRPQWRGRGRGVGLGRITPCAYGWTRRKSPSEADRQRGDRRDPRAERYRWPPASSAPRPRRATCPLQLNVNTRGRLQTEQEFRDIILKTSPDGGVTYLADVARVELDAQEYGLRSLLDNRQAIGMGIMQAPGVNALDVADQVRATMLELAQDFPPGVEYRIEYDPTSSCAPASRRWCTPCSRPSPWWCWW